MNKFDTEATAVKAITDLKKPDCVEALEREFWQARSEGLDIRESAKKAEIVHFINDHNGLDLTEERELENNVTTDEGVYAYLETIGAGAIAQGEDATEINALNGQFRYWYDLYRSWGADVYLSYTAAVAVTTAIYDETHDLDEATAIAAINEIPSEGISDTLLRTFYTLRNEGKTVRESLQSTRNLAERLILSNLLSEFGINSGTRADGNRLN